MLVYKSQKLVVRALLILILSLGFSNTKLKPVATETIVITVAGTAVVTYVGKWLYNWYFSGVSPKTSPQGKVIILNGTSSAGKSSIVRELQKLARQKPYEVVSFDAIYYANDFRLARETLIEWLPKKVKRELGAKEKAWILREDLGVVDEVLKTLKEKRRKELPDIDLYVLPGERDDFDELLSVRAGKEMSRMIIDFASQGRNVILDVPIDNFDGFLSCKNLESVFLIDVYCSPAVLVEHVKARNTSGALEEERSFFQAIGQFSEIYRGWRSGDVYPIDTFKEKEFIDALGFIAGEVEKKLKEGDQGIEAKFAKFKNTLKTDFNLKGDPAAQVQVVLRFDHDFVVDTGKFSAQACAEQIVKYCTSQSGGAFRKNIQRLEKEEKMVEGKKDK